MKVGARIEVRSSIEGVEEHPFKGNKEEEDITAMMAIDNDIPVLPEEMNLNKEFLY